MSRMDGKDGQPKHLHTQNAEGRAASDIKTNSSNSNINPDPHPTPHPPAIRANGELHKKINRARVHHLSFLSAMRSRQKDTPHNSRYATIATPKCIQFPNSKIAHLTFKTHHHTGLTLTKDPKKGDKHPKNLPRTLKLELRSGM